MKKHLFKRLVFIFKIDLSSDQKARLKYKPKIYSFPELLQSIGVSSISVSINALH